MPENNDNDLGWGEDESLSSSQQTMNKLGRLCQERQRAADQVKELEAMLAEHKRVVQAYDLEYIPDCLDEAGFEEVTLATGEKVSINKIYSASIKQENWETAKKWLADRELDDMISLEIKTRFGKGREATEQSIQLMQFLKSAHIAYQGKEGVHPMTLKSFVKQRMEDGQEIPQDLFGIHVVRQAKIK